MKKKSRNRNTFFKSPAISMMVLVGFLCIQFHSFTHIDLSSFSLDGKTHHIENTSSQVPEHLSSDQDTLEDCADCVLVKHLQASVKQGGFLLLSNTIGFLAVYSNEAVFESQDDFFQLRAPPFYVV